VEELVEWIRANSVEKPVSQVLPRVLELAQRVGERDLEHWTRMELVGYDREGGMKEEEVVPEYRGVTGRYLNRHGQMLHLANPRLGFVNIHRFRFGVSELEQLAARTDAITIRDEGFISLLREELNLDVQSFCFSPIELHGVLNRIRSRLLEKVNALECCKRS
jgi:hypothetical protein